MSPINGPETQRNSARGDGVLRLPISKFTNRDEKNLGYKVQNSTSVMVSNLASKNRSKRDGNNLDNRFNSITPKL